MYNDLMNRFFKENKDESTTPGVAAIAHFNMRLASRPDVGDKAHSMMHELVFESAPHRKEEIMPGLEEINSATTSEQLIKIMRRDMDIMNRPAFFSKAIQMETEIIPEVVRRLKTNLISGFIEVAAELLVRTSINVSEEVIAYFDDMRSPYAQSLVLVMLGFKADEKHIPWFIEKYNKLKKTYPRENYHDGAYYGLCEMDMRFYPE